MSADTKYCSSPSALYSPNLMQQLGILVNTLPMGILPVCFLGVQLAFSSLFSFYFCNNIEKETVYNVDCSCHGRLQL